MPFEIVRNDIVNMQVDAVVNTANPNPVIGSGVDSGIHKKAGYELLKVTVEYQSEQETEVEEPSTEAGVEENTESVAEEAVSDNTVEVEIEVPEEELDVLAQNGLVITPQGSMIIPAGTTDNEGTFLDELQDVSADISVETLTVEDGTVNTVFKATLARPRNTFLLQLQSFDRYTGYRLCIEDENIGEEGGVTEKSYMLEVGDKTYECKYSMDWVPVGTEYYEATIVINHPAEYDGVVFYIGKYTPSQKPVSDGIDWTQPVNLMDYPELLEGQYFFTATDK